MNPAIQPRNYLITGAGGISSATAVGAIASNHSVFIVSSGLAECEELCSELERHGGKCGYAVADLRQEDAVESAVQTCLKKFDRIDGLFNCAGISGRRFGDGPTHECTAEGWRHTMAVNVESAFLMSRAVLKQMLSQAQDSLGQRGSIVNMSSVLAFSPRADYFGTHAYAASKGAVMALSSAMAATYAPQKIRVNTLAPGLVRTPMSLRAQSDASIVELLKHKQPLTADFVTSGDVAAAALFLLGTASAAITGVTLPVDAGWTMSG